MGGGKLPPRQKMIGMMYLVLTALLAMNVSKDILNAFIIVNEGLQNTNESFEAKTKLTLASFEKVASKDAKAKPFFDKAKEAQKLAQEVNEHITELKKHIIMVTDKKTKEAADTLITKMRSIDAKDNYDVPTEILIGAEPAKPKAKTEKFSALELKDKIDVLKDKLIKILDIIPLPDTRKRAQESVKRQLNTDITVIENGVKEGWADANFYHLPLAAVITNLTRIQSDINNAEADIVNVLLNSVGANDVKISGFQAEVIAKSSYVLQGDQYEAEVLLVAQSSSTKPRIFIGDTSKLKASTAGAEALEVVNGIGIYKKTAGGEGVQKWSGIIEIDKPDGTVEKYPFYQEYTTAKPAAAVSPDKMNVFYIGVDNPVSISAAGVSLENLSAQMSGDGTISGSRGKYNVKVNKGPKCTINVMAKQEKGSKSMGAFEFRVKRLPDPVAKVAGLKEGTIKRGMLLASGFVKAEMENFDFDLKVTIKEFTLTAIVGGDPIEIKGVGGTFTEKMNDAIKKVKNNGKVFIEGIKAQMPDGSVRPLSPISLKVQI